jgi:DNA-binding LytR/AlgR family response regulator
MINAVIIEDEVASQVSLVNMLGETTAAPIRVQAVLGSVKESLQYFAGKIAPDLIFSDIQLSDGLSFEIFSQSGIDTPVIFTTCYDHFLMNALDSNGIDYLLKPFNRYDLDKSLSKYCMLQSHFGVQQNTVKNLVNYLADKRKTRLIVKKGFHNISLKIEDISMFYTENRVVYVFDRCGKKCLIDKNLGDLESELDSTLFFRANRQFLINLEFVKSYKTYERVKLQVELGITGFDHLIIISQENTPAFKKWVAGE